MKLVFFLVASKVISKINISGQQQLMVTMTSIFEIEIYDDDELHQHNVNSCSNRHSFQYK